MSTRAAIWQYDIQNGGHIGLAFTLYFFQSLAYLALRLADLIPRLVSRPRVRRVPKIAPMVNELRMFHVVRLSPR